MRSQISYSEASELVRDGTDTPYGGLIIHGLSPGGTVFLRRGVVHGYQNFTTTEARPLIATTPGVFSTTSITRPERTPSRDYPVGDSGRGRLTERRRRLRSRCCSCRSALEIGRERSDINRY
jgi:hypothetical protein